MFVCLFACLFVYLFVRLFQVSNIQTSLMDCSQTYSNIQWRIVCLFLFFFVFALLGCLFVSSLAVRGELPLCSFVCLCFASFDVCLFCVCLFAS